MFKNTKIALFSDLHIGVHKNHPDWHKVSLQFGEWFVKDLTDRGIRDIVFCGDYFHTRHEIEQTTLKILI
jgi:metallophosphoesterase superfamily enzyme